MSIAAALVAPRASCTPEAEFGTCSPLLQAAVEDEIDVGRFEPCARDGTTRSNCRQLNGRHVRNTTLLHARPAGYPRVVGLQESGDVSIGQHGRWHTSAPTGDGSISHGIFRDYGKQMKSPHEGWPDILYG
jgi:hypothetical protein